MINKSGKNRISPRITASNRHSRVRTLLTRFGVFIFWIALWQLAAMKVDLELILPTPLTCLTTLLSLLPTKTLWVAVGSSMGRIFTGYAIGCIIGMILGAIAYFLPIAGEFIKPLLTVIKATPVSSFILLAVLWMSPNSVPVLIAALMVLPIVFGNTLTGLSEHSAELREVAHVYGLSKLECARSLFIPAVIPYISAAALTSLGLAWKAGIAAEILVVTKDSIGQWLYYSKLYFETAQLFAWTVTVIILSFALEKIIKLIVTLTDKRSTPTERKETAK